MGSEQSYTASEFVGNCRLYLNCCRHYMPRLSKLAVNIEIRLEEWFTAELEGGPISRLSFTSLLKTKESNGWKQQKMAALTCTE